MITAEFNCLIILLSSSRFSQTQRSPHVFYRHDLINQLQHNHALVTLVAENLETYMESMRLYARGMYCNLTWAMGNHSSFPSQLFLISYRRSDNRYIFKDARFYNLCSFMSLWSSFTSYLTHPKLQASSSRLFTKCLPFLLSFLNWFLFLLCLGALPAYTTIGCYLSRYGPDSLPSFVSFLPPPLSF